MCHNSSVFMHDVFPLMATDILKIGADSDGLNSSGYVYATTRSEFDLFLTTQTVNFLRLKQYDPKAEIIKTGKHANKFCYVDLMAPSLEEAASRLHNVHQKGFNIEDEWVAVLIRPLKHHFEA